MLHVGDDTQETTPEGFRSKQVCHISPHHYSLDHDVTFDQISDNLHICTSVAPNSPVHKLSTELAGSAVHDLAQPPRTSQRNNRTIQPTSHSTNGATESALVTSLRSHPCLYYLNSNSYPVIHQSSIYRKQRWSCKSLADGSPSGST